MIGLERYVRCCIALGPWCLTIIWAILSRPEAFDVFAFVVKESTSILLCLWMRVRIRFLVLPHDVGCAVKGKWQGSSHNLLPLLWMWTILLDK